MTCEVGGDSPQARTASWVRLSFCTSKDGYETDMHPEVMLLQEKGPAHRCQGSIMAWDNSASIGATECRLHRPSTRFRTVPPSYSVAVAHLVVSLNPM